MTNPVSAVSFKTQHDGHMMVVTKRTGATSDMVAKTLMHFRLAKAALERGIVTLDNCPEPAMPTPHTLHDSPLVTVWGDAIFHYNGKDINVSINICTENTTAQDILDEIAGLADGLAQSKTISIKEYLPAVEEPQLAKTADEFYKAAAANGGAVDLAQQFPRDAKPAPPADEPTDAPDIIETFDYKQVEQYEREYIGEAVGVKIGKIQHAVEAKKDKTGFYEVYSFTPFFNGDLSKYAPFVLNQFVPAASSKQYNFDIFKHLRTLLPQAGATVEGDMTVWFKVNMSDTNNKIYWNVQRIDNAPDVQPHHDDVEAVDDAELDEAALNELMSSSSEIPF